MNSGVTIWQAPSQELTIGSGGVHLWRFNLNCTPQSLEKNRLLLNEEELNRADCLLDFQKKNQFILSRAGLRMILAKYLSIHPKRISFQNTPAGKPSLATSHGSALTFNLSHSGQCAALAVANGTKVGIDIEFIDRSLDYKKISVHYFDASERELLACYSFTRQRRGFYRLWTQKEAVLKLYGSGFSPSENIDNEEGFAYHKNFFLAPGYVAAIAIDRQVLSIVRSTFPVCHAVLSLEDGSITSGSRY